MAKLKLDDPALVDLPGLRPTATVPERLSAFQAVGLSTADVATAAAVSDATIRNWGESSTAPRESAARALDDLRVAIVALAEASIHGARAATWLTSRNTGPWLEGQRPIEILRDDPLLVLAAIEDLIASDEERGEGAERTTHLRLVHPPSTGADPGSPRRRRIGPRRRAMDR